MFKWLKGNAGKVLTEIWTFGREVAAGRVGDEWLKYTKKVIDEDPRCDIMETIRRLEGVNPAKAKVLFIRLDRAAKTQKPDLENNVMVAMGHLLPRDKDGVVKLDEAVEVFEWLAEKDDAHFAVGVEAMKHDPIIQMVRYWVGKKGLDGLKLIAGFVSESGKLGWQGVLKRIPDKKQLKDADKAMNDAILQFRVNQKWLKRSRRRQDELDNQMREQREQQVRDRIFESFDRFRRDWAADERGGQR